MGRFEQECLEAHNMYRARHGTAPLQLDDELCAYASRWAQVLADRNELKHRDANHYGENLFMVGGRQINGYDTAQAWYDEARSYNYYQPAFTMTTGHFTQMVWRQSQKLGVGVAKRGNKTWVVANYDPPGNFLGKFAENVRPPLHS